MNNVKPCALLTFAALSLLSPVRACAQNELLPAILTVPKRTVQVEQIVKALERVRNDYRQFLDDAALLKQKLERSDNAQHVQAAKDLASVLAIEKEDDSRLKLFRAASVLKGKKLSIGEIRQAVIHADGVSSSFGRQGKIFMTPLDSCRDLLTGQQEVLQGSRLEFKKIQGNEDRMPRDRNAQQSCILADKERQLGELVDDLIKQGNRNLVPEDCAKKLAIIRQDMQFVQRQLFVTACGPEVQKRQEKIIAALREVMGQLEAQPRPKWLTDDLGRA